MSSNTMKPINLQTGWPSARLCASAAILNGAQQVLTSETEAGPAILYGPRIGHAPLRESLATWLSNFYAQSTAGAPTTKDRIAISNGASGNLANILQKFADPLYTRAIFLAEPTYFLACPIMEDNGFRGKLRGVPEGGPEHGGLDLEFLRQRLHETETEAVRTAAESGRADAPVLKAGPSYPKVFKYIIYVVPTFANPSGKTMAERTRRKLVRMAREFDALVISDDVYDYLRWPASPTGDDGTTVALPPLPPPPSRLVDIDCGMDGYDGDWGNTLSNGSFSKIIGPGVRVGWADCAPRLAFELGEVGSSSSGGGPAHLSSTFVDKMIRGGELDAHIQTVLIPTYRRRYHAMMGCIAQMLLPLGVKVESSMPEEEPITALAGGFFVYLRLPDDVPHARTVASVALREQGLRIAFGHLFVVAGNKESIARAEGPGGIARCFRLCWAWHEEEEIREGVQRLADTLVSIRESISRGEAIWEEAIGVR
ncbi:pyridoxal phosphate-dependent transferase [Apiospora phragmitis]|uniref:Pyridoxal phosphate-dependent transferase n=1 Tax=Apiospora phragmitis TaxID=2905665 RepID=A0ABR1T813_9PEZI